MHSITDSFSKVGQLTQVEGNKPLLACDENCAFIVNKGTIEAFVVEVTNGQATGRRRHFLTANTGDLLCGIRPLAGETSFGLLLVGAPGSEVRSVGLADFCALSVGHEEYAGALVDRWILSLSQQIGSGLPDRGAVSLLPDAQMDVAASVDVESQKHVQWVKLVSGSYAILGPVKLLINDTDTILPLVGDMRFRTDQASTFSSQSTALFLRDANFPRALQDFAFLCFSAAVEQRRQMDVAEKARLQARVKRDAKVMADSLSHLLQITGQSELPAAVTVEDKLLSACQLVGAAMNTPIAKPVNAVDDAPFTDKVMEIARASRIRVRRVTLAGDWWKADGGPLLAWRKDDESPVALLPSGSVAYRLADPATTARPLVTKELAGELSDVAFAFYRSFPAKKLSLKDILKFGFQGCWKHDLILLLLTGLVGGLLGLATPKATQVVFGFIIPDGDRGSIWQVAILLSAVTISTALFQLSRAFASLRLKTTMDISIQSAVWDRLLSLPTPFFKKYSAGELAMRAMSISQVREVMSDSVVSSVLSGVFSVFYLGQMFFYSTKLALGATILAVISVAITTALGLAQMRCQKALLDVQNKLAGLVLQLIGGVAKLRVAGSEGRGFLLWSKTFAQQRRLAFRSETYANYLATFNAVFSVLTSMTLFYLVVKGTDTGAITTGSFIAFNAAFGSFLAAMAGLSAVSIKLLSIVPLLESAQPIIESIPEYDESKRDVGTLEGNIELHRVTFRYQPEAPPVLNDVSLEIKAGEYVAIVGPSGSGKSTLLRLLLGFETPESGLIFYDNYDLAEVDVRSVRRLLGVVLQNGQLMSGDIFTNIVGSKLSLTMDDAWEAAKLAGLDQDIRQMPMGMFTMVGEGAGTLSGGQRQRLLIARALATRPKIVYFDEATSALDNRTQSIVADSLAELHSTRIVIAHRLSTVIHCDRIVVMSRGQIVEQGNYHELMAKQGLFAELANRQIA